MSTHLKLHKLTERLERENPGKTIVLDLRTLEVVAISENHDQIAKAVAALKDHVVPLFIGGPCSSFSLRLRAFASLR